jgi:hypothetical protein
VYGVALAAFYLQEILDAHDGALQTRRLKLIGAGGTHFVFANPEGSQDYVIKIARQQNSAEGSPRRGQGESCAAAGLNDALDRYFPIDWLATSYSASAPVVMPDGTFRPLATVIVQRYESNFLNDDRVGLQSGYPELVSSSPEAAIRYRSINTLLNGQWSSQAIDDFATGYPNLAEIASLTVGDTGFQEVLTALLTGTERIVAETSEIIDLIGNDNVFFYKTDQRWMCRIGEIVKQDRLDRFNDLFARPELFDELTNPELGQILNGMAFIRLMNVLSLLSTGRASIDLAMSDDSLQILSRRFESGFWLGRLTEHLQTLRL